MGTEALRRPIGEWAEGCLLRRECHFLGEASRARLPLLTLRTADLARAGVRVPVFAELLMVRLFVAT